MKSLRIFLLEGAHMDKLTKFIIISMSNLTMSGEEKFSNLKT